METKNFIENAINDNNVVLFMKGTAQFPQCGFSGKLVDILRKCGISNIATINVLEDDDVRQGIKDFSNWPTVPQLYINGKFVGGSDIVSEMFESGELKQMLLDENLLPTN
jgi:monothiol glutaredoxin